MSDESKTPEEIAAEAAAAAALDAKKKKKLKFDPEQTEFINSLYGNAFAEGAKKAEEAVKAQLEEEKKAREDLAKQFEELKKTQKPVAPPKVEEPKVDPKLDEFKAQLEEMRGILGSIKTERDELKKRVDSADEMARKSKKKDKFLEAIKEAGVTFFDPLEAYELAEKTGYEWDKDADRPVVINRDTSRPKLNENGDPMTVVDFVKDFADKKKYLVKAPNQEGGTGGGGQRKVDESKPLTDKSFADMTEEEFEAYTQKALRAKR
jgi:archaellum component FlaC